jgi:hypothetical protein
MWGEQDQARFKGKNLFDAGIFYRTQIDAILTYAYGVFMESIIGSGSNVPP